MNIKKLFLIVITFALVLTACTPKPTATEEPTVAPVDTEEPTAVPVDTEEPTAAPVDTETPESAVELRFMFYADGNEAEIMQPLVDEFNAANPDIVVKLDVVPYQTIDEQLPVQAEAGQVPDVARITNFGAFRGLLLDLRPLLEDPDYFEDNFPSEILDALRPEGDTTGLYGFPETLTVTGPFVNKTLFDQAGVDMPGEGATWYDWTEATRQVKEATGVSYAITIDATGHRLAGPVLSMGATLLTPDGEFIVDTQGFREFAQLLKSWHEEELAPKEVWLGPTNASCIDPFKSGELVFCLAGSWQIGGLANDVGNKFDWVVVQNPTGPGGSVGIAGGDAVVAFAGTEYPQEVARFMEFLIQPENYSEFSAGTLSLPAHSEVTSTGVEFKTDNPQVFDALSAFTAGIPNINDQGWALNPHPFAFAYYRNAATRLSQYIAGELTLDEALEYLQKDIDEAIAAGD